MELDEQEWRSIRNKSEAWRTVEGKKLEMIVEEEAQRVGRKNAKLDTKDLKGKYWN